MNTSATNINQVLNQIRIRSQFVDNVKEQSGTEKTDFSALLKDTINNVTELQKTAGDMKSAYERGDTNIDLPEVMIAGQKAALSFEAVAEVRNRVLNAYQEIMNMQL